MHWLRLNLSLVLRHLNSMNSRSNLLTVLLIFSCSLDKLSQKAIEGTETFLLIFGFIRKKKNTFHSAVIPYVIWFQPLELLRV